MATKLHTRTPHCLIATNHFHWLPFFRLRQSDYLLTFMFCNFHHCRILWHYDATVLTMLQVPSNVAHSSHCWVLFMHLFNISHCCNTFFAAFSCSLFYYLQLSLLLIGCVCATWCCKQFQYTTHKLVTADS